MRKIVIVLILILLSTLIVQAQEFLYLPLIFKDDDVIQNSWRLIDRVGSSNYCLNPSAETTGNFVAESGTTVTRSTTYQKYGLYSYRIQSNADDEGIQLTLSSLANDIHFVTVRMRGVVPDWDWSLDNSTYREPKFIEKIDDNWNLYGALFPASEANGSTTLRIHQKGVGNGDFYIDGIQVEPLNYWTTYIDGTQTGCEWLGDEHASISQRSSESKAGGESQDFYEEYGFFIEKVVGAGSAPLGVNTQSYATLPGGEFSSEKSEVRDWTLIGRFVADTPEKLHEYRQELRSALLQQNGQGTPIRYGGAKVQKEITAYYTGGLEGDLAAFYGDYTVDGENWQRNTHYTEKAAIQLLSPNPYWFEVGESAATLDTNDSATFRTVASRLRSTGQWDDLGPPDASGTYSEVQAFAEDDTYVYLGGIFTNFNNIANADRIVRYEKATGTWSALGSGLSSDVYALEVASNGDLYIGGQFTNAGGVAAADYLTRWDGSSYNAVGTPNTGAASITAVLSLKFDLNGDLYIGGSFLNWADIANADYLAKWDGSSYSAVVSGLDDPVQDMAIGLDNTVFIGGTFNNPVVYAGYWNGSTFTQIGDGVTIASPVEAVAIDKRTGLVYLGGQDGIVWTWNGTTLVEIGTVSGKSGTIVSLSVAVTDSIVYAGGSFDEIGGVDTTDSAARWNGSVWAHFDINFPGSAIVNDVFASAYADPVNSRKYDVWAGFTTEGTGNYGGLVTVENEGTVPAFPEIKFNRSGGTSATVETLRNERTARELLFDYDLQDGETLVIDLQPTAKSIISLPFEQKKPGAVLANSDFGQWVLLPGDNDVTSFVNVAGGPTITASLLWRDTYEGFD